jgi:hypothetical protein
LGIFKWKENVLTSSVVKTATVRFQVLTATSKMFIIVFWDVLPCKIIVERRFRGAFSLLPVVGRREPR